MERRWLCIDRESKAPILSSGDERRDRSLRPQSPRRCLRDLFRPGLPATAQSTGNELTPGRLSNGLFGASRIFCPRRSHPTRYSVSPLRNLACFAEGLAAVPIVSSAPDTYVSLS